MKTKPGVTSRLREIRKRADHVALTNRVLRSNLVSYAAFSQIMEKVMPKLRDYLYASVSQSQDLAENIDSWGDRLKAVAEAQAALHEKEEIEEEPAVPDIPEEGSALQKERARESNFRADLWTLRNQILRAELIDSGAVFRGLGGIFSFIVQMVKGGAGDPIETLKTVSSWKLPKCEDETSTALARRLLQLCEPKTPISPSEWQEEYRIAPSGSVKEGKWKNFCFQKEPLDCFTDPEVSTVTMQWASQLLGKTSTLLGILAYVIDQEPTQVLIVHPTFDSARAWAKNSLGPLIENCSTLVQRIDEVETKRGSRSGYGENTVLRKQFAGGWILALGANSPAPLRGHTARVVLLDEVDGYESSAGSEGDTATLAMQRNIKWPNAKTFLTSTPTIKHFSRIEKSYLASDMRRWMCTCPNPRCGNNRWVLTFHDIKWQKTRDNEGRIVELPATAELACPQCDSRFNDSERMEIVKGGRWVATKPEVKGHRGYHLSGFVVLDQCKAGFSSWMHYFAQRFLDAKALGTNGLRTFETLICGNSYEIESSKTTDSDVLYSRRELYPGYEDRILPSAKCLATFGAVDVQRNRLEAGVAAYCPGEEIYWLAFGRFYGSPQNESLWDEMFDWITRPWKHPSGHTFFGSPVVTCIDSAEQGDMVHAFCAKRSARFCKFIPVRGERGYETEEWIRHSNTKAQLRLLKVDGPKETIYRRLRILMPGAEFIHFPSNQGAGFDRAFFEQLTSEVMMTDKAVPHFQKPYSEMRNEALDIAVYCEAARQIANPDYAAIQRWLATPPDRDWRTGGSAPASKSPVLPARPQQYTGDVGMEALKSKYPKPPSWLNIGK
jgi:phage terminase large subunit GpA-like protein